MWTKPGEQAPGSAGLAGGGRWAQRDPGTGPVLPHRVLLTQPGPAAQSTRHPASSRRALGAVFQHQELRPDPLYRRFPSARVRRRSPSLTVAGSRQESATHAHCDVFTRGNERRRACAVLALLSSAGTPQPPCACAAAAAPGGPGLHEPGSGRGCGMAGTGPGPQRPRAPGAHRRPPPPHVCPP